MTLFRASTFHKPTHHGMKQLHIFRGILNALELLEDEFKLDFEDMLTRKLDS
jgi:hypothetical protein